MKRFLLPLILFITTMAYGSSILINGTGGGGSGIAKYATFADLPTPCADGDVAVTEDTGVIYVCTANVWNPSAGPSVPLAVGTFDSQAASANGATIASNQLFMQSADATHPGLVNFGAQTFGGTKTFDNVISLGLTADTALVANGSKQLASSATTSTELGYVSGVTSAIQTQLNGKQTSGNYITALTGDVTASGPGSVASTLATVNSNVGSFAYGAFTVNAKGLITAASNPTGTQGGLPYFSSTSALSSSAAGSSGQILRSGGTGSPTWSTATYPATAITAGTFLRSNGTNWNVSGTTIPDTGTSGGILAYTGAGVLSSSAALAANQLVLGGGAGVVPATLGSLGTTTTVLHGNAAGAPTFGAIVNSDITNATIDLTTKVTGSLPIANGGTAGTTAATARTSLAVFGKVTVQTFTASGTYTPTSGMLYATIEVVGGGGGGGGVAGGSSNTSVGGSGGAGGYARKTVTAATIGASQTVTIGAAGTAGSAGNNDGGAGGTTSVGAIVSATGGAKGDGGGASAVLYTKSGGAGGAGSSGDLNVNGQAGSPGVAYTYAVQALAVSGNGGSSYYGPGGAGNANGAGVAGGGYGAGGSAGSTSNNGAGAAGGAGVSGLVVITEYGT